MTIWWLMFACGITTFLIRFSFIGTEGRLSMPVWIRKVLPYVPIAALTALVAPDIVLLAGRISIGIENSRLWAALIAIAVAAIWRNTLVTIGVGFAGFTALRHLT